MKKIYYLFLLFLLFAACSPKENYVINVQLPTANYTGSQAFLMAINEQQTDFYKIDSAIIRDSEIQFKGFRDSAVYGVIMLPAVSAIPVVIEAGEITVNVAANFQSFVSGTPLNDSIQHFYTSQDSVYKSLNAWLDSIPEDSIEIYLDSLSHRINDLNFSFIRNNIQNVAGEALAQNYMRLFDSNRQEEILSLASGPFKSTPKMQAIADQIDAAKAMINKYYTDFEAEDKTGKKVKLSDIIKKNNVDKNNVNKNNVDKNSVVLINFWASWCPVCTEDEMPYLHRLHNRYKDKGFKLVSVSLDKDKSAWKKARRSDEWLQLIDTDGNAAKAYKVELNMLPYSVLLNKWGNIVGINLSSSSLRQKIEELTK